MLLMMGVCNIRTIHTTYAAALKTTTHPKNPVQKTICCNSTSNAPDDGRMHHPHRTHDLRSGSQDHRPSKKLGAENHMLQLNI